MVFLCKFTGLIFIKEASICILSRTDAKLAHQSICCLRKHEKRFEINKMVLVWECVCVFLCGNKVFYLDNQRRSKTMFLNYINVSLWDQISCDYKGFLCLLLLYLNFSLFSQQYNPPGALEWSLCCIYRRDGMERRAAFCSSQNRRTVSHLCLCALRCRLAQII